MVTFGESGVSAQRLNLAQLGHLRAVKRYEAARTAPFGGRLGGMNLRLGRRTAPQVRRRVIPSAALAGLIECWKRLNAVGRPSGTVESPHSCPINGQRY